MVGNLVGGKAHGVVVIFWCGALIAVGDGNEFEQIVISDLVFCEQDQMTRDTANLEVFGNPIRLDAEYEFDIGPVLAIEIHSFDKALGEP